MNILILGATGRVGHRVLEQALKDGHRVTALVRSPEKIASQSEFLSPIQGNVCSEGDLYRAMQVTEAEVVISCLGTDGGSTLTESMPLIIQAMKAHHVKRVITIGTAGILQSREYPGLLRYESPESRRSSTRAAKEHRKAWEMLASSGLDWTVVCPTYLPDGEATGEYRIEKDYLPEGGMSITVGDTADFTYLLAQNGGEYVGFRVGVAY